jgi:hypothetical protein
MARPGTAAPEGDGERETSKRLKREELSTVAWARRRTGP